VGGPADHGTFVTADGVALDGAIVDRMAAAGIVAGATEAWLPDGPPVPPVAAARLEQCWRNFGRMHRAGVGVLCCSDAGVGPGKPHDVLPHGLILFSRLGFTNLQALRSATGPAAQACGVGDLKGRLRPGLRRRSSGGRRRSDDRHARPATARRPGAGSALVRSTWSSEHPICATG
jgi:imidazolonepropionase-like amidohydrolase